LTSVFHQRKGSTHQYIKSSVSAEVSGDASRPVPSARGEKECKRRMIKLDDEQKETVACQVTTEALSRQ
jgi:hypothetical protein